MCRFTFVEHPRTDYENIYSKDYYDGIGADPLVQYQFECQNEAQTIRRYEWQALVALYDALHLAVRERERERERECVCVWLDYGCGYGGLVTYGREQGKAIWGYEPNVASDRPFLLDVDALQKLTEKRKWDFISCVEVIEHVARPLDLLAQLRGLLNPGGILFMTTGNARPWRGKMTNWSYTSCPDVHVSFFEPETLALALQRSGFTPCFVENKALFVNMIRFKILKNLGVKRNHSIQNLLPWKIITRLADALYQVSAMPYGIAC